MKPEKNALSLLWNKKKRFTDPAHNTRKNIVLVEKMFMYFMRIKTVWWIMNKPG